MKRTKEEIQIAYCNFIGRNTELTGVCSFEKVPPGFYERYEVSE